MCRATAVGSSVFALTVDLATLGMRFARPAAGSSECKVHGQCFGRAWIPHRTQSVRDLIAPRCSNQRDYTPRGRHGLRRRETSLKEVVPVNESHISPRARSAHDAAHPEGGSVGPAAVPTQPEGAARRPGWTGGRVTALVTGVLLALVSLCLLGGGGTAVWADGQRDAAGYLTTGVHEFSTPGSALATERIDLGSAGIGWLYSPALLGTVRIRVTPVSPGPALFAGIGPSADVDRYLAGVSHTVISDFWGDKLQAIGGGTPGSAPATQGFWVAAATGPGTQTLRWDPASGIWTVVVMNADGRPGIRVRTDLGATYPDLLGIAVGMLAAGTVFGVGAALLIAGAIRRRSASRARTV